MFVPANLLASAEETKPNTTKADMHLEHKNTTTELCKLNIFHDFQPVRMAFYKRGVYCCVFMNIMYIAMRF